MSERVTPGTAGYDAYRKNEAIDNSMHRSVEQAHSDSQTQKAADDKKNEQNTSSGIGPAAILSLSKNEPAENVDWLYKMHNHITNERMSGMSEPEEDIEDEGEVRETEREDSKSSTLKAEEKNTTFTQETKNEDKVVLAKDGILQKAGKRLLNHAQKAQNSLFSFIA